MIENSQFNMDSLELVGLLPPKKPKNVMEWISIAKPREEWVKKVQKMCFLKGDQTKIDEAGFQAYQYALIIKYRKPLND